MASDAPGRRVAIVGGGPGGAHCARRLAETGHAVTLFEPRTHYEKPCGGGIPARGLERFPFLQEPRLPGRTIARCLLVGPGGHQAWIPLRDPLYVFRRADLHTFLLDRAAGAGAVIERRRVAAFERRAGWIVTTEDGHCHGPFGFLVAADGAAGMARRRLAGGIPSRGLTQGIGYYLPGLSEDFITLKFYPGLAGYLWVFPRPEHSSAGICGPLAAQPAERLRRLMDGFLAARYGAALVARSERYAALIPGAPEDPAGEPIQGDGWALVGDTARAVDPLTREGIYFAMLSGEVLAECLAAGRPGRYAAAWAERTAPELSWAARHASGFFADRFTARLVALCGRSPAVARVMSDLIAGRQSYRGLKRRLLLSAPRVGLELAAGLFTAARGS
jgi:geranylgeranyl reductase